MMRNKIDRAVVERHRRTKSNNSVNGQGDPLVCPRCSITFGSFTKLVHSRHPYPCLSCEETFKDAYELKTHKRNEHNDTLSKSPNVNSMLSKSSSTKFDLHTGYGLPVTEKHLKKKQQFCTNCELAIRDSCNFLGDESGSSSGTSRSQREQEANGTEHRLLRKRRLDSDSARPLAKKNSIQKSVEEQIRSPVSQKIQNKLQIIDSLNCIDSSMAETDPKRISMRCPKCCYECESLIKYQNHPCEKILVDMKSCVVQLDMLSGLDVYTRNNLFFSQPFKRFKKCQKGNSTGHILLRKKVPHRDSTKKMVKKNSVQNSIEEQLNPAFKRIKNNLQVTVSSNCNASSATVTDPKRIGIRCPKCCYECECLIEYQNHPCEKILVGMKSCVVKLDKLPGLGVNTRGNLLFYECFKCKRVFLDVFSQHASFHSEVQFSKSFMLNISSANYPTDINTDLISLHDNENSYNNALSLDQCASVSTNSCDSVPCKSQTNSSFINYHVNKGLSLDHSVNNALTGSESVSSLPQNVSNPDQCASVASTDCSDSVSSIPQICPFVNNGCSNVSNLDQCASVASIVNDSVSSAAQTNCSFINNSGSNVLNPDQSASNTSTESDTIPSASQTLISLCCIS